MRKSLLIMVVVLTAFSVQTASAFLPQGCCCCFPEFREKTLELNVGYRRDYINWEFKDPSVNLIQILLPIAVEKLKLDDSSSSVAGLFPALSLDSINLDGLGLGVAEAIIGNNNVYHKQWRNLRSINVGGLARAVTCNNLYGRFSGNWAYIVEGQTRSHGLFAGDREFLNDLFSDCGIGFTPCKKVCGHTWDVSGAIGYQLRLCDCDFLFTPLLGFAYNDINVKTNNNDFFTNNSNFLNLFNQIFDGVNVENSTFKGFSESKYHGYFTGPYLGFDAVYQLNCRLNLYTGFEYHWAAYHADTYNKAAIDISVNGDVLLGTHDFDFDGSSITSFNDARFKHYAYARGLFWNLGGNYNFCKCWTGGIKFSWMDWKSFRPGRIRADVENNLKANITLDNRVVNENFVNFTSIFRKDADLQTTHWGSYRIEVTVGYEI